MISFFKKKIQKKPQNILLGKCDDANNNYTRNQIHKLEIKCGAGERQWRYHWRRCPPASNPVLINPGISTEKQQTTPTPWQRPRSCNKLDIKDETNIVMSNNAA